MLPLPLDPVPPPQRSRCREIEASDLEGVLALLCEGFPGRNEACWRQGLQALATRSLQPDVPRFGYLLEQDGHLAGALLLIFVPAEATADGPRCNVSSWYVRPQFRHLANVLVKQALRLKQVTYTNLSPAPKTLPLLKAQGYKRYSAGSFLALPLLGRGLQRKVRAFDAQRDAAFLPPHELRLLSDHAALDCIVLVGEDAQGLVPFVLNRAESKRWPVEMAGLMRRVGPTHLRRIPSIIVRRLLRIRSLIYCRDTADLARFAHPLGYWLLRHHGITLVRLDAPAPPQGLIGRFSPGRDPKYFRGLNAPPLNDLAYSELVYFGS